MRSVQIDAERALHSGLVNASLPIENFFSLALAEVEALVADEAVSASLPVYKRLLRRKEAPQIQQALAAEFVELDKRFANGDAKKALVKLVGKRQQTKETSRL